MDQLKQEQQAREEREKLDGRALILVERQLTGDQESPPVDDATLRDAIRAASPETRRMIFYKAKEMRSENWRDNKARVERTIPVFRALIESDPEKKFHRNYAQMAYALKDKSEPDAKTALELLNQAIQIRDARGETNWLFYEFNRALCRIMLDPQAQAGEKSSAAIRRAILADLQT